MTNRAALGFVMCLAACGGGAGPATSYDSPTAFCREYAKRYVAGNYACIGGLGAPPVAATMRDFCASLDGALARGEISYDKAAGAACLGDLDHLFDVRCNGDLPCLDHVVQGHVATGASCGSSMECAVPGAVCRGPERACGGDVCVAIPAFYAQLGAACAETEPCAEGLRCDLSGGGDIGTCITQVPGAACEADFECLTWNEYCSDAGSCVPRLAVGAPCADVPWACVPLAVCDAASGKCVAAGQNGQDCGFFGVCWSGNCDDEDGSATYGKCVARSAAGQPCFDDWQCASGTCGEAELCVDCP